VPVDKKRLLGAVEEAKTRSPKRGFNQSVDLIVVLGDIDIKRPENRINELIELPYAPKADVQITVFASGDLALRARNAGSEVLGRDTLEAFSTDRKAAKKLAKANDFFVAETTLMSTVGKVLGPVLGPRGKMPTPVPPTAPIDRIITRLRKSVRVRVRDNLSAQCSVGTTEMGDEMVAENIQAILTRLEDRLEKGARSIRESYVKTSMGPVVKIGK
jgi:large subunit ribosomal protein L1